MLVALIIFAIGLLATASLQLASLRATQFSNQQVVATSFAREYGEIMQLIPASAMRARNSSAVKINFSLDTDFLVYGRLPPKEGAPEPKRLEDMNDKEKEEFYEKKAAEQATKKAFAKSVKNCTGKGADCSPEEMFKALQADWALRVTEDLPSGRAVVCRDNLNLDSEGNYKWFGGTGQNKNKCENVGEMMRVKIGWHGKNFGKTNENVNQKWATGDHPRMIVSVMGNLKDYAAPAP